MFYRAGAPCTEQKNHLTYWSYFLSKQSERYAAISGPDPWKLKVMILGNYRGADLPKDIPKFRGTDVRQVTEFLIRSRRMALEKIKLDPSLTFTSFPSQAQFRTTRRLVGEHTLLTSDAGKHYEDSIGCASIFNIAKPVYELPFGMLYTKSIKNIFAAGRIVSSSNGHAWEISRTIPASATTGQAAGSAAALLAYTGKAVQVEELQSILQRDGVRLTMSETMVHQSEDWLRGWRKQDDPFYMDQPIERGELTERTI